MVQANVTMSAPLSMLIESDALIIWTYLRLIAAFLPLDVLQYFTSFASANRPGGCSDIVLLVRLNLIMFLPTNDTSYRDVFVYMQ